MHACANAVLVMCSYYLVALSSRAYLQYVESSTLEIQPNKTRKNIKITRSVINFTLD
jgi:hypothetical protein